MEHVGAWRTRSAAATALATVCIGREAPPVGVAVANQSPAASISRVPNRRYAATLSRAPLRGGKPGSITRREMVPLRAGRSGISPRLRGARRSPANISPMRDLQTDDSRERLLVDFHELVALRAPLLCDAETMRKATEVNIYIYICRYR